MNIEDRVSNYMSLLLGDTANPAANEKETADQTAVPGGNADSVTISPVAALLGEEKAHHERMLAIRQQLSEGTYNISGKDVADKILNVLKG